MKVKTASHWGKDKAHERYALESTEMSNASKGPSPEELYQQVRQPTGRGSVNIRDDEAATNKEGK